MEELRDFFRLSRSERKGAAILLVLLIASFGLNRYLTSRRAQVSFGTPERWEAFDQWVVSSRNVEEDEDEDEDGVEKFIPLGRFDPDTLDSVDWVSFGLRPGVVRALLRYKSAIGGFSEVGALEKFRLFPEGFVESLEDRMEFTSRPEKKSLIKGSNNEQVSTASNQFVWPERPKMSNAVIELNSADSASLEALPGIGPGTAGRICKYRERLGGFHDLEQLSEVWGIKPENLERAMPQISLNANNCRVICLNDPDEARMSDHPYIGRRLAKVIKSYVEQHGPFHDPIELKGCVLITDSLYVKLEPYFGICE